MWLVLSNICWLTFPSRLRIGVKQSERPNQMARKKFKNTHSICFTRVILSDFYNFLCVSNHKFKINLFNITEGQFSVQLIPVKVFVKLLPPTKLPVSKKRWLEWIVHVFKSLIEYLYKDLFSSWHVLMDKELKNATIASKMFEKRTGSNICISWLCRTKKKIKKTV